jgi:DNA mismatch repair protein MutL
VYDDLTGIRYLIDGGVEKLNEEIGCPNGTTFIVNNLFYNTPARRKFLKTPPTEAGYISELINKLALGNPHISFKFINNGQLKLHTSGNTKLKDCIFNIFGKDITMNLLEINYKEENFSIDGYVGKPQISRANRNYENYYINGRYIKSKVIMKAIEDAFKTKLTVHRYPFVAFNLKINPELIDVNVHPTKMDIRFNNEQDIYNALYNTINNSFNVTEIIPEVTFGNAKKEVHTKIKEAPEPFEVNRKFKEDMVNRQREEKIVNKKQSHFSTNNSVGTNKTPYVLNNIKYPQEQQLNTVYKGDITKKNVEKNSPILKGEQVSTNLFTSKSNIKEHKIVGSLFDTYWIVEFKDKYYMIDQHAAHERVLYERIIGTLKNRESISQVLLQPLIVNLSMKEKVRFDIHKNLFLELGFEVEDFGGDSISIRSVPYIFNRNMKPEDFTSILDMLDDEYKEDKYEILLDSIAQMACKAAVKAKDKLSHMEYHKLIDELIALDNPFNCPHGRPTIISMTKYELEKKFKRIQ